MIIQAQLTNNKQHYQLFIRGEYAASILPENLFERYFIGFLCELAIDLDNNAIHCVQRDRAYKFIDYCLNKRDAIDFTEKLKHLPQILHTCLRYSLYEEYLKTISDYYIHIRPLFIYGNYKLAA